MTKKFSFFSVADERNDQKLSYELILSVNCEFALIITAGCCL